MSTKKTRKLLINGWFWGQTTTGSGQYLHGLMRHLPAALPADWQTTLLLPPTSIAATNPPPAPAGVRIIRASLPAYARGARLRKLSWEQRVFPDWCKREQATVAFVPYWGSPLRPPCPTIVTIHDLIPLLLEDYANKTTARAYTQMVARAAKNAAAVITVSQSARNDIVQHLGIAPARVHNAYESLGVPHAPVTNEGERVRARQRYHLPRRFLFYLGGFDPRKNVPLLIRAYGRARTQRSDLPPLLIAGKLPAPDDTWFTDPRPIITELGLHDYVRTLGFIPDVDKPVLYSMADLFLFPSRYEGFGLPPLEAITCGTPALVSANSSLPEIVGDTLAPVVIEESVTPTAASEEQLAQALLAALDHPPSPTSLLAQAARYSWQQTAQIVSKTIVDIARKAGT